MGTVYVLTIDAVERDPFASQVPARGSLRLYPYVHNTYGSRRKRFAPYSHTARKTGVCEDRRRVVLSRMYHTIYVYYLLNTLYYIPVHII